MGIASLLKQVDVESAGLHELTDDELLQVQNMLAEMMQDISEVCESNGISWCLFGGSVLGCVRHGGFIPWDDDIDIFMLREDYNKFREIFPETLSSKYVLKEPGDKGYLMHYPQVQKKGTNLKLIQSVNDSREGLVLDIFLMENTYDNKLMRGLHGLECTIYLFIDSVLRLEKCKENMLKYSANDPELRKELNWRLFFAKFFHFRSMEEWLVRSDKCFSKVKNQHSKLLAAPSGVKHFFGELYDREKMCDLMKAKFADKEFIIMKDYDYYLTKRYGSDYMTPPEEKDREKHVYIEFDLGNNDSED